MMYNGYHHETAKDAAKASDDLWRRLGGPVEKLNFPTKKEAENYDKQHGIIKKG